MIKTLDIAWLAGLLEGEGSFGITNGSPWIQFQSTDKDVVQRAALILSFEFRDNQYKPRGPAYYKPVWGLSLHGIRAIAWMMTLFVLLGERRQSKVREVIEAWKASKAMPRASRGTRLMATCHPDKPRAAHGLCRTCWMREYRKTTGRTGTYYRKRAEEAAAAAEPSLFDCSET